MKNKKGFTLIEVIVSIVILAMIVGFALVIIFKTSRIKKNTIRNDNITNIITRLFDEFETDPTSYDDTKDKTFYYDELFSNEITSGINYINVDYTVSSSRKMVIKVCVNGQEFTYRGKGTFSLEVLS